MAAQTRRASDRSKGQPRRDGATEVRTPADGSPGNTLWDREWMRIYGQALVPIDDDDGVPFGSRMKWTGNKEDTGSEWQIPEPSGRCIGTAFIRDLEGRRIVGDDMEPLTRRCHRWPIKGGNVCIKHGGSIEAVRNAANLRLLAAADAVSGRLIALALDPETPAKEQIMAINSVLDRAGIKVGGDTSVTTPEWQHVLRDLFEGKPEPEPEQPTPMHVLSAPVRRRPRKAPKVDED